MKLLREEYDGPDSRTDAEKATDGRERIHRAVQQRVLPPTRLPTSRTSRNPGSSSAPPPPTLV
ncbi:TPA: hypothetical protein EYN98_17450 [Candidatus Poribacteria bacterium]|nr:hypothetical protein [Candidatus Poribacteria bacterium]